MKALKTSTWVLAGLGVLTVALGATLFFAGTADRLFGAAHWHFTGRADSSLLPEELAGKKLSELTSEELELLRQERWSRFGRFSGARRWERDAHRGVPLTGLLFVAGAAVLVVVLAKRRKQTHPSGTDSSLEILEEQFAEGKIDERELERKRAVLRNEGKGGRS